MATRPTSRSGSRGRGLAIALALLGALACTQMEGYEDPNSDKSDEGDQCGLFSCEEAAAAADENIPVSGLAFRAQLTEVEPGTPATQSYNAWPYRRRETLLADPATRYYFVPSNPADSDPESSPGILLVVEATYLDDAHLVAVASEAIDAYIRVPQALDLPDVQERMTVYLYPPTSGELSVYNSDLGFRDGEPGIMLKKPSSSTARPTYHEFVHAIAALRFSDEERVFSGSISEGLADLVQNQFRPDQIETYFPFLPNPHLAALESDLLGTEIVVQVGETGRAPSFDDRDARVFFYSASTSFVTWLKTQGPDDGSEMNRLVEIYGYNDYDATYGSDLASLRESWLNWLVSTAH